MSEILSHIDAGVMTLTFNRVDKKNSLTSAMYTALADAVEQAERNPEVRVLVFQGHEAVFCAGNDIAVLQLMHYGCVMQTTPKPEALNRKVYCPHNIAIAFHS